jgi:hypothetical protein
MRIQPNKACWILVDGRVADVSEEGWNDEGTAFSHGIFVKQWVKFRTHNFCPDKSEREMASGIERRAKQIFAEKPEILVETDEEGHENLFAGDLGYVQAAEEQGWIRSRSHLISGFAEICDIRCFFYHLKEDCKADDAKIQKAKKKRVIKQIVDSPCKQLLIGLTKFVLAVFPTRSQQKLAIHLGAMERPEELKKSLLFLRGRTVEVLSVLQILP